MMGNDFDDHYVRFPIRIYFDTEKQRAAFGEGEYVDVSPTSHDLSRLADADCPVVCVGLRFDRTNGKLLSSYSGVNTVSPTARRLFEKPLLRDCVIHAEENMLMSAEISWPYRRLDAAVVYGLPPCLRCAARLKDAGVSYVLWVPSSRNEILAEKLPRWEESLNASLRLFEASGIVFEFIPPGKDSPDRMFLLTPPYAGILI